MKQLIEFLLQELKSSIEKEHTILKLLKDLIKQYKLRIDLDKCEVLDWGILENEEEVIE